MNRLRAALVLVSSALAATGGCAGSECTVWRDQDGDGWGDPAASATACEPPSDGASRPGDCDDGAPGVNHDAVEGCDGVDQDCDGLVDDDPLPQRFLDGDGDGFGDPDRPLPGCDAWGVEDATDCDDADPGLHPDTTWFADADGDGFGDTPVGQGCASPTATAVRWGGDCDDEDPQTWPGAPERCDGRDQDCLGGVEGSDTWAFPDLEVRVPLTVDGDGSTVPLAVDLDLAGALLELGFEEPFDPESLRVAVQECGRPEGERELPSQWLDHVTGLLSAGPKTDPDGDGVGALVALWDTDARADTVERWPSAPVQLAVYLQGPRSADGFATDLVVAGTSLSAGGMVARFEPAAGGLLSSLTLGDGPSVGSQADATRGNGVLTPSGPLSAHEVEGRLEIVDLGPLTAAVTARADLHGASGGLLSETTYRVFAGRPALVVVPRSVTTSALSIHGETDRAEPIRPFQLATGLVGASCEGAPGLAWADLSTGEDGLTWAWVAAPRWIVALGCDGAETWSSANDLQGGAPGQGTDGTVPTGTPVADGPVAVFLPHGPRGAAAVSEEREAWRTPVVPTIGEPQTWRRR